MNLLFNSFDGGRRDSIVKCRETMFEGKGPVKI